MKYKGSVKGEGKKQRKVRKRRIGTTTYLLYLLLFEVISFIQCLLFSFVVFAVGRGFKANGNDGVRVLLVSFIGNLNSELGQT